ncbi:MAG: nickel-dependent lactate racemase [Actinobacteria bacterium]|nr:nickel-dependent lactate racemase [Actinomycetota bacterium]
MIIELDYGDEKLKVEISKKNLLYIITSKPVKPVSDPKDALLKSIKNPIGCLPLSERIRGKKNICIVISDITRAVPSKLILEVILGELSDCGVKEDLITILIATGLHRPNVGKELEGLVGKEIADRYHIVNHNARDRNSCEHIGNTKRGTPVIINRVFLDADFKILTGLIEPHFMAGFSGGRKAVCPGISYMDMFRHFHGPDILESENASVGVLDGNPFHEESTEIAKLADADFIVNVTINKDKEVTGVFSGDLEEAFYAGAKFCMDSSCYPIKEEADIVITTGGGLPLDATLYQTVKGIVGALPAVKQGGMIAVAAECSEEIGSKEFVEIIEQEKDIDGFMKKITDRDYFKIDQWEFEELIKARRKAEIYLYSGCLLAGSYKIPPSTLKLVRTVDEAIEIGLRKFGDNATISVIPEGPYTIPVKLEKKFNPSSI